MAWDCRRHLHVVARGLNMHGEPIEIDGTEMLARCVQHEVDHLNGVLFVDRLDAETRKRALREIREAPWFGGQPPQVKISPHPLLGKAL
jgi:peptide deformylase